MSAVKTRTVPALDRALTMLELLSRSRSGMTLPELAEQTNLPRSSAHYLLVTLERRGYLQRNQRTSRYLFGGQALELAGSILPSLGIRQVASPFLLRLATQTGLTAHLAVRERYAAVLIAKCEGPRPERLPTWVGRRFSLHSTSLGKAMLAHLPAGELEALLAAHPLARHNQHTMVSPKRVQEEAARVAAAGYALDNEEEELGLRCVGAPVRHGDRVLAAVSVCGLAEAWDAGRLQELAGQLQHTAAQLAAVLSET
ncbi:MAG: IclR family transcriptional regulator [Acidobacteriota bacterium]|jgi:DNA-binding IclR family transcriptional regulator|nr:IclR family transcriptional regulator [Acidobacteriaceae bacterium]